MSKSITNVNLIPESIVTSFTSLKGGRPFIAKCIKDCEEVKIGIIYVGIVVWLYSGGYTGYDRVDICDQHYIFVRYLKPEETVRSFRTRRT